MTPKELSNIRRKLKVSFPLPPVLLSIVIAVVKGEPKRQNQE
jgi:hypothetical protein